MRRRGESGQKGGRGRPYARKAPTARVSNAELQEQAAVLTRELKEAREQQTATSEVLQIRSCGVAVPRGLPRFFAVE